MVLGLALVTAWEAGVVAQGASKSAAAPPPSRSALEEYFAGLGPNGLLVLDIVRRVVVGVLLLVAARLLYLLCVAALGRAAKRLQKPGVDDSRVSARRQQHLATVIGLLGNVAWYVIAIAAGILVLYHVFSLNVVPLLTGAGIVGVAIAFGSQALVRDVVTGIFQLLEGQYAVGDYVHIGATFGKVEEVGLRVTRVRDMQGRLQFIPNGSISQVITYDDPVERYMLQAPFSDGERAEEARQAIAQLAEDLQAGYPQLIVSVGEPVVASRESGVHSVGLPFGIEPSQGWLATDEAPARVKQLFALREVAIPETRPPRCYLEPPARAQALAEGK
jgi:small conductance mechanosensitive channel